MPTLQYAVERLDQARQYTNQLLAVVEDDLWFVMPPGCPTHIAWQVGHIAMAQYALCLMRVRDAQPGDRELMSREFRKHFSKGTIPDGNPANNPSLEEIRRVFDAVHAQVMKELPGLDEQELHRPLAAPHERFTTKIGALHFAADHEMLHAGQIGLLRRLLGNEPLR